ncbi:uncharacterized protein [Penaeus vannamei]|uniref:uncharacterized protein n=1 Tax=Penaeus vannamei TaxID=6689 RepID=UPI000F669B25|nr:uncharacterized protein LOC113800763 [Penaeus vannamei]
MMHLTANHRHAATFTHDDPRDHGSPPTICRRLVEPVSRCAISAEDVQMARGRADLRGRAMSRTHIRPWSKRKLYIPVPVQRKQLITPTTLLAQYFLILEQFRRIHPFVTAGRTGIPRIRSRHQPRTGAAG